MLGTHRVCVLESSSIIYVHAYILYLPHAHAQGVKQLSVVVVVVRTKIACLGDLGAWAASKVNEYVEIGEKMASVYFESFCTDTRSVQILHAGYVLCRALVMECSYDQA